MSINTFILYIILILILIFIIPWILGQIYFFIYLRKYPSPPQLPFLGHVIYVRSPKDILKIASGLLKKYKTKVLRVGAFFYGGLLVQDVKMLKFLLSSTQTIDKAKPYEWLHSWLNTGLLTSTGSKWHNRRKFLTPAFHFKIVEQFIDVFDKNNQILIETFEKQKNVSFDVFPLIKAYTLDVICETSMGTSINAQKGKSVEYVNAVKIMCNIIITRTLNPLYLTNMLYQFTSLYRDECEALKILHGFSDSVIRKRREDLLKNLNTHRKRKSFLDLLLQANIDGESLTDLEIREEVDTFLFAGHDTTASAISFALYSLANNPHVQERVHEEIISVLGNDPKRTMTCEDLHEMKYLDMVLKETLRMYPSVPLIMRQLSEFVKYDDVVLPKFLNIFIYIYGVHMDPDNFKNPTIFDPERFAPLAEERDHFVYFPFSAGPRNCIGQKFAMLEMKSVLSSILRRFKLNPSETPHQLHLSAETIMKSTTGIVISVSARD